MTTGARHLESLVRLPVHLTGDDHFALALPSIPGEIDAIGEVFRRVEALSSSVASRELAQVRRGFEARHNGLPSRLEEHYLVACAKLHRNPDHGEPWRALLGSYFTM